MEEREVNRKCRGRGREKNTYNMRNYVTATHMHMN